MKKSLGERWPLILPYAPLGDIVVLRSAQVFLTLKYFTMRDATNSVVPFEYESHQIRSITIDDQPYFVAIDVCDVLGINNAKDVVRRQLDDDEKTKRLIVAPSDNKERETWLINESGLYAIIMRSNKPEARAFRKWVTSVVLPALRKQGSYTVPSALAQQQEELKCMIEQASELAGSQERLAQRIGISSATLTQLVHHIGYIEKVSPRTLDKISRVCAHIIEKGVGYDEGTVDLLMQVDNKEIRMALFSKMKDSGIL